MSQPIILQVENLTRQFAGTAQPAVSNVGLQLRQGDILSLLGPSGCGKTTLLRLIAGFEKPDSGTVQIANETVAGNGFWHPPERRDVGMVFQDYALFPHLTVAQNIGFGLKARRRSPQQERDMVKGAIALVGLSGFEQRYPHELSGGQQQRVALARALAPQPSLILLDEPLSNLDVQVRLRLRQEVREILKKTDTSAVFVTHDQEEALSISDWIAVMRSGKIEQFGSPETLYQQPASRFVAEFVAQANFIPATFDGLYWQTEIGKFQPNVSAPESLMPSAQADLMIRQEDLELVADESGNLLVGDRQFLGRDYLYNLIAPSGLTLRARSAVAKPMEIGVKVQVHLTGSAIQLFPAER
ncbi:MAG TPA: ABC transporter ATP-binding protein [Leptolyngbyaceae cyanobacterium M33_DOE_097]|uniref:ABC-type quaternary amine transporter n=1 Tax=Oscillatoriales cyanobacterium SpSt-418 TaxID=2282169 RepID=A0A7C3P9Y9_9CYAN|nr:ABC transporter ATP-binding protein [Leptolyngbyaceae cyanobacterium M33_DOE_097]